MFIYFSYFVVAMCTVKYMSISAKSTVFSIREVQSFQSSILKAMCTVKYMSVSAKSTVFTIREVQSFQSSILKSYVYREIYVRLCEVYCFQYSGGSEFSIKYTYRQI